MRDVVVVPTSDWGGRGVLGCNVAWETAEHAMENTWRIVQVDQGSAAARLGSSADSNAGGGGYGGLMAQRDHIIGAQTYPHSADSISLFKDSNDFHQRVEAWREYVQTHTYSGGNHPGILLLIYDAVDNAVKEIYMNTFQQHNGEYDLSLGLDVANGFLHQIPSLSARDGGSLPMVKRFVVINEATHNANSGPSPAAAVMPASVPQPGTTAGALDVPPLQKAQFQSPFVPEAAPVEPSLTYGAAPAPISSPHLAPESLSPVSQNQPSSNQMSVASVTAAPPPTPVTSASNVTPAAPAAVQPAPAHQENTGVPPPQQFFSTPFPAAQQLPASGAFQAPQYAMAPSPFGNFQ